MAPRRVGGGLKRADANGVVGGDDNQLVPYPENIALLVITAIALVGMVPLVTAMLKTDKIRYNLDRMGFQPLKYAILMLTLYVSSSITQLHQTN
jgi:hypothetical protein